jgi:ABC-type glycerol-3-phosphate transport system substrate-binding protein
MKTKMRCVVFSIIIMAIFLLSPLYAGGNTEATAKQRVKISYWSTSKSTDLDKLIVQFETENPDIDVDFVYIPYTNALADMITGFKGGKGPDVVELIQSWTPRMVVEGYLKDITPFIEKDIEKEDFFEMGWDAVKQGDKIYAVPTRLGIEAMYFNKNLLHLAGFDNPPKTWEEFYTFGEALKKQGKYAYGITAVNPNDLSYRFLSWLFTAGGEIADENWTEALIDEPNAIYALEYETNMMKNGFAPRSGMSDGSGDVYLMFVADQVATMIRGPLDMYAIYRDNPEFYAENLIIGSMPQFRPDIPSATASYVYGLGMGSQTKHQEAAWKLISFLTRPENVGKISYGDLPSRHSALDYPGPALIGDTGVSYKGTLYEAFLEQAEHARVLPTHPAWPEISKVIWDEYQQVLAGAKTAETAAGDMGKAIDDILDGWNKATK